MQLFDGINARSELFAYTLVFAAAACLLLFAWRYTGRLAFLAIWSAASGFAATATALYCVRGFVPDKMVILGANSCLFTAWALLWAGARNLRELAAPVRLVLTPMVLWVAASFLPGFFESLQFRFVIILAINIPLCIATSLMLLGYREQGQRSRDAILFAALSMGYIVTIVGLVVAGIPPAWSATGTALLGTQFICIAFVGLVIAHEKTAFRDAALLAVTQIREGRLRAELAEHKAVTLRDYMDTLFQRPAIASVFLDADLRIRRFSPAILSIFNLTETDIGRPLIAIACQLSYPRLRADLDQVLALGEEIERMIPAHEGSSRYLARVLPYKSDAGAVAGIILNFVNITKFSPSEERLRSLVEELNHRIRNLMTVVIVHARRSFHDIPEAGERLRAFVARMTALGISYTLLSDNKWQRTELRLLFERMLENHLKPKSSRVSLVGPTVWVDADRLLALNLVVHELITNAEKYGAFSLPFGHVDVAWSVTLQPGSACLQLRWTERDGPPVTEPGKAGMGTALIRGEIGYRLGGEVTFDYAPKGLVVDIRLPLNETPESGPTATGKPLPP